MDRLKELGTWVILVIAFWLFSNGMIYLYLHSIDMENNNETITNNVTSQSLLKK